MKSPFDRSMIKRLVGAIGNAEIETFDDYINNKIKEEDAVSSTLASKIEDECNRIFRKSKNYHNWRCSRTILAGRGRNSPEKKYGFDIAITLKDEEKRTIKTVIIQNKFEKNNDPNIKTQVANMEKLTEKGSFVGIFSIDGMYVSSTKDVKDSTYQIDKLIYPTKAKRLSDFMEEFFVCKIGQVNFDPSVLNNAKKEKMIWVLFSNGKPLPWSKS
jgi:hypothetical protein